MKKASETKYYLCHLQRGSTETVGWIPERGATKGAWVELLTDGFKGDLWNVTSVCAGAISEEYLREKQRLDKNCFASLN